MVKRHFWKNKDGSLEYIYLLSGTIPNGEERELLELEITEEQEEILESVPKIFFNGEVIKIENTEEYVLRSIDIARNKRKKSYPVFGDQLDSIWKILKNLCILNGISLDSEEIFSKIQDVKRNIAIPENKI